MPLFQASVLKKYTNALDTATVDAAYERFAAHFHNAVIQENIRQAKEEQYQGEFLIDLFVKVLGYVKNPAPDFNLTTELKNVKDSKKADGAIIKNETALGVIELKGTSVTDLGKVETQAFGYKNNQPGCVYVITSNFEKLRFYIDNAVDFEEFNLFQLTRERFEVLWLCLSAEKLLRGLPKQIKDESLNREEVVTKTLYKDYALFRNEVFNNIVSNNPQHDKLTLFKETQKLLDRFLFIFFAEDRLLLPPNSILSIVQQWKDLKDNYDAYTPLYERFKKYFGYLNTGYKGKNHDIFAYNGGLFKPDPILDDLTIDDELLEKHTMKLSNYDFVSEVSVNILGHIFEHSLNDIEEIQAEIEGQPVDKTAGKRKKDGVFYTPKYITKYIVDNTVGKLCEEQKTALDIDEAEYDKGRKNRPVKVVKALAQKLDDYRAWLLQLTICDPACGSGAFLNQALEFLIAEHAYVDELRAKLFGDALLLSDVENSILEHNLYGVDINQESVEIAKLSLWLRTAQKGRRLTSLNNNIKCGNSLIDDPAVAGDKAFNWEKEFPQVFTKGGFDVVIGNPPYVRQELLGSEQKDYFSVKYKDCFNYSADLYVYFYELSISILKSKGLLGFITPNKWMERKYGFELRAYLKQLNILQIINYGELRVFEDAATEPAIIIIENYKDINSDIDYVMIKSLYDAENYIYNLKSYSKNNLKESIWRFTDNTINLILEKFSDSDITLFDYTKGGVYYGIKTGFNKAFIIDQKTKDHISSKDIKSNDILRKMVEGDDFYKWSLNHSGRYMIATQFDLNVPTEYPAVFEYLKQYEDNLIKRQDKGLNYWNLRACDYYDKLENPKLIYYHTAVNHSFYYDTEGYYISANCYFIANADRYLQCILNSQLFNFVKKFLFPSFGDSEKGGRVRLDANKMVKLPIKEISHSLKTQFENKAIEITSRSLDFQKITLSFISLFKSKFPIEKPSKNLQSWHTLDFKGFLKELKKAKVSLTLTEEAEWMAYFNAEKEKAGALQNDIDRLDKEIDQMVYGLYGLTEDEVAIVENS